LPKEKTIPAGFIVAVNDQEAVTNSPSYSLGERCLEGTAMHSQSRYRALIGLGVPAFASGDKEVHTHATPGLMTLPNAA
jgi:hypothetical protein